MTIRAKDALSNSVQRSGVRASRVRLGVAGILVPAGLALLASTPAYAADTPPAAPPGQAAPADANVNEARLHYDKGMQFYTEANYDAALVEMERAYKIAPSYRILYNLGTIQKGRNNYAAALRHFDDYLQEGGDNIPTARRAEVDKEIAALRSRVASVEVRVNVAGAEIAVDDVVVGQSPLLKSIVVNPGRRKITASKVGLAPVTRTLSLAAADAEVVKLDLVSSGTRIVVKESDPKWRNRAIVAWSTTGVLLGAATVTGIFALRASSDLEEQRKELNVSADDLSSQSSKARNLGLVTDIMGGVAIVGAGVATFFTVKAIQAGSHERSSTTTASTTTMNLGFGPGNVLLHGKF